MASPSSDSWRMAATILLGSLWGLSKQPYWLASSILMPVLWLHMQNRWTAGLIPTLYALTATRGLIEGGAVFFDRGTAFGIMLWLAAGLPHYLAGWLCWLGNARKRMFIGIPLFCLMLAVPPVMLVGWAHPLLASGLWFPRLGLWSPLLALLFMIVLASISFRLSSRRWQTILFAIVSVQAIARHESPAFTAPDFTAHHTRFAIGTYGAPAADTSALLQRHWQMMTMLDQSDAPIHVFPESVGGYWDEFISDQWQGHLRRAHPQKTVLIGAYQRINGQPQGVVLAINANQAMVFYRQRLPMTGGMFNPFAEDSFRADWFGRSTVSLGGKRLAVAICFEYVVLLPVLQATWTNPDAVIAPASIWWASRQLQQAQQQSLHLWAFWLDVPFISSINGGHDV